MSSFKLIIVITCAARALLLAQSTYQITDLGTLPGQTNSVATAINDSGQVAGYSGNHGFFWDGVMTDLGVVDTSHPAGIYMNAANPIGINAAGQVFYSSTTASGYDHAFIWDKGVATDLGALPNYPGSVAMAINDSGQVVGYARSAASTTHAFLWSNGVMTDLGTPPNPTGPQSCDVSFGLAINSGQILGSAQLWTNNCGEPPSGYIFIWNNAAYTSAFNFGRAGIQPTGLNSLEQAAGYYIPDGGPQIAWVWQNDTITYLVSDVSQALGINDSGQVVGWGQVTSPIVSLHGFLWQNGLTTDLGTLPGFTNSSANGINRQGQIAGTSYNGSSSDGQGFIWMNGAMTGLGTLPGDTFSNALQINNHGQIIGQSGAADQFGDITAQHAVLWTPAPATALLQSGAACNGVYNQPFQGNIIVTAGQNCVFQGGSITGNVTVQGGRFTLSNATVSGNMGVSGHSSFSVGPSATIGGNLQIHNLVFAAAISQVCGANIRSNLEVNNNAAPVAIGSQLSCQGNTIGGNLEVANNSASTSADGNTVIGNFEDQNNRGATEVFNNTVRGNLQCGQNSSIAGGGDTATLKQGQCAGF